MARNLRAFLVLLVTLPAAGASVMASNDPFLGYDGPVYPNSVMLTNATAYDMVAGDFNEDGRVDLLVVSDGNGFGVLFGNGDCTFTRMSLPMVSRGPGVIGDFNEDNHQDIAAADTGNSFAIILGNGDGTFGPVVSVSVPTLPTNSYSWGLAAGDFNGNNHDDLVLGFVGVDAPYPIAFFSGNGDGTFTAPTTFSSGTVWSFGVGDFDENGDLDLITNDATPRVHLGGGNGTFTAAGSYPMGNGNGRPLLVADFNDDGHMDFARPNFSPGDVSVRLGNGDGTFGAEARYPAGDAASGLSLGDVDNDGNSDLVVADQPVSVLLGNGDGTFGAAVQIEHEHGAERVVAADINNDGWLDLATAGQGVLSVNLGHGDGTFDGGVDPAYIRSFGSGWSVEAVFGDINKDGLQDAALLHDAGADSVEVLLADGTGSFVQSATGAAGAGPTDIAIADVNNDTNPDLLATAFDDNTVSILLGHGDGSFDPAYNVPTRDALSIATGFFDADTNVDLAVLSTGSGPQVRVLSGNGDGTFLFSGAFGVGSGPTKVESGDFDENGEVDLLVVNLGTSDLSVLLGVGDGTFQPEVRYGPFAFSAITVITLGDVNADGHQDILVPTRPDHVLYGAGDGTFGALTPVGTGSSNGNAVGDANGDGRTDLIGVAGVVLLQLRQGDGTFGTPSYFWSEDNMWSTILEDTNGDGRTDVIVATTFGITTLLNVEPSPFGFQNDKNTMRWPNVSGALTYNVYRGLISSLTDGDDDGLPDAGYGDCQNALDPDTTDLHYIDATVPAPGTGYFYLIGAVDWAGERYLGTTSEGLTRAPALVCPP